MPSDLCRCGHPESMHEEYDMARPSEPPDYAYCCEAPGCSCEEYELEPDDAS